MSRFALSSAGRAPQWQRTTGLALLSLLTVVAVAWFDVRFAQSTDKPLWMADLQVYLGAGVNTLKGGDPWAINPAGWSFLYPPPTQWLFAGLTKIDLPTLGLLYTILNVALLGYVIWSVLDQARPGKGRETVVLALVALPFCTWFGPVTDSLLLGNVDLIIMALLFADLVQLRNSKWQGVLLGLAVALKLQSGLFVVFLLLGRRFRPAITAAVTFVVMTLGSLVFEPGITKHYWFEVFPHLTERMGGVPQVIYSNGFLSALTRVTHNSTAATILWIPVVLAVGVAGLLIARRAVQQNDEVLAVLVCGLVSVTVTSLAWVHYWVWIIPFALFFLVRSIQRRNLPLALMTLVLVAVFNARVYRFDDLLTLGLNGWLHDLTPLQQLLTSLYALGTIAVLTLSWSYLRQNEPVAHQDDELVLASR